MLILRGLRFKPGAEIGPFNIFKMGSRKQLDFDPDQIASRTVVRHKIESNLVFLKGKRQKRAIAGNPLSAGFWVFVP